MKKATRIKNDQPVEDFKMGLMYKLVPEWFNPACDNCRYHKECESEPKHYAYPTRWMWIGRQIVKFRTREGDLVVNEGRLEYFNKHPKSRVIEPGCLHYRVARRYTKNLLAHHEQYLDYLKELYDLIQTGKHSSRLDDLRSQIYDLQMENL